MFFRKWFLFLLTAIVAPYALASEAIPSYEECMQEQMINGDPTVSLGEIRSLCLKQRDIYLSNYSAARERFAMEQRTGWNPFVITPHNINYLIPYSAVSGLGKNYDNSFDNETVEGKEAKLQISLKVPLNEQDLLFSDDVVYFAFTLKAFWQVYNHEISSPFRETNYRPELYYMIPIINYFQNADAAVAVGVEHESNGRSADLSRSWNRIFLNYYFAKDNYLISFRPWYRIPEKEKSRPDSPKGDDNPDIDDYMGYFELMGTWEQNRYEFSLMVRNNMRSENRGAFRLDASFPLWGKLRGLVQYYNGYGESMIDYDQYIQRIGIGILLTDIL